MANTIETLMIDDSTTISSAEYNLNKNEMIVYFNNEGIYKYSSIPLFYWRGLFESASKGKFLNQFILGKFTFTKLN
jgi:hypothetical protein